MRADGRHIPIAIHDLCHSYIARGGGTRVGGTYEERRTELADMLIQLAQLQDETALKRWAELAAKQPVGKL